MNLNKLKRTKITKIMFSDHYELKPEISNRKITEKSLKIWKWNDALINNAQVKEVSREIRKYIFLKIFIYLFLERGEEERERNINLWLSFMCPQLGTGPTTQACTLTGNWIFNPLVHRTALNPLSHTSQS